MYASAPTTPEPMMVIICEVVICSPSFTTSLRTRWVMLQNRNMIPAALSTADIIFTMSATCSGDAKSEKKLAVSMKKGAPGGWPISNLLPDRINSGQSQKLAVGSTVRQYVTVATMKQSQPKRLFTVL